MSSAEAQPVTRAELLHEIEEKMARVQQFLKERNLGGIVLTQVRNFSWMTGGIADNHIVITSESGAASLLILRDGRKIVLASHSEMPRLMAEDLEGLGYQAVETKWYENKIPEIVAILAPGVTIATDSTLGNLPELDAPFAELRYRLTDSEITKYRWLGRNTNEAIVSVCKKLRTGMSEREIEAMISDELMHRNIRPTVLLIGTDDRIMNFRHAPPSDARLKKYGMVNVCARRWGLVIASTRFVHFGALPPELKTRLAAAAKVNAEYQAHSTPGTKAGDIFEMAKKWYADAGFPGESEKHHQGGAIGYAERDWLALPGSMNVIHERQAFAWNPTVMGAKVEDTILVFADHVENLTETPGWPVITTTIDGKTYHSPDILIRTAPSSSAAKKP